MSSSEEKLIQRLLKIWSDSNFTGSFSGIKNFQNHLLFEKNLKVKRSLIRKALNRLPEFSTTITKKHKFLRRHYSVTQSRELGEIDYAELRMSPIKSLGILFASYPIYSLTKFISVPDN